MDGSAEPQGQEINRVKAALPGLLLDFQDNPPPGDNPFDEPSYTGSASRKLGRIVVQRRFLTFAASSVWASARQRTDADADGGLLSRRGPEERSLREPGPPYAVTRLGAATRLPPISHPLPAEGLDLPHERRRLTGMDTTLVDRPRPTTPTQHPNPQTPRPTTTR